MAKNMRRKQNDQTKQRNINEPLETNENNRPTTNKCINSETIVKKKRGRPKKVKKTKQLKTDNVSINQSLLQNSINETIEYINKTSNNNQDDNLSNVITPTSVRKRGRPPKKQNNRYQLTNIENHTTSIQQKEKDCHTSSNVIENAIVPFQENFIFNIIDSHWQQTKLQELQIQQYLHEYHTQQPCISLGNPTCIIPILGDGNCFFRCISYFLTGTQNHHNICRQLTVNYMHTIRNQFENIIMNRCSEILPKQHISISKKRQSAKYYRTVESLEGYIKASQMNKLGKWATEIEIYTVSALLETDIYIYTLHGTTWQWTKYSASELLQTYRPCDKAIYLQHANLNHFECVIEVEANTTVEPQDMNYSQENIHNTNQEFSNLLNIEFDKQMKTNKQQIAKKALLQIQETTTETTKQNDFKTEKSTKKKKPTSKKICNNTKQTSKKPKSKNKSKPNKTCKKRKTNKIYQKRKPNRKNTFPTKRKKTTNKNRKIPNKRQKTSHTTSFTNDHSGISNENAKCDRRYDGNNLKECIDNFINITSQGPIYVCTCCNQLSFKKSCDIVSQTSTIQLNKTFKKCTTNTISVDNKEYICSTCKYSILQNKIPRLSIANKLSFPKKPPQLDLHHTEEKLISLRNVFMQIRQLPRGGQRSVHGNCVNVPCDLKPIINVLPRNVTDSDTIAVKYKRKLSYDHCIVHENIRPKKVLQALHYLIQNSTLYKESGIQIDPTWERKTISDSNSTRSSFVENDSLQNNPNTNIDSESDTDTNASTTVPNDSKNNIQNTNIEFESNSDRNNDYSNTNNQLQSINSNINNESDSDTPKTFAGFDYEGNSIYDSSESDHQHDSDSDEPDTHTPKTFAGFDYEGNSIYDSSESDHQHDSDSDKSDHFSEVENNNDNVGTTDTLLDEEHMNVNAIYNFAPSEGQKPLSLFQDENSEYLAFPTIFCGEKRIPNTERPVSIYYSEICKWELKSIDRRCAMSIPNIFYKLKRKQNKEVIEKATIALRRFKTSDNKYTASEMLNPQNVENLVHLDTGYRVFKDIRNSPPYLEKRKRDVFSMIRQLGLPTFFISLSSADSHWEDLRHVLGITVDSKDYSEEELSTMDWKTRARLIQSDPVTCTRFFNNRVKDFISIVLKSSHNPIGDFQDFFYRVEFQQRGSPHIHMLQWNKNAPQFDTNSEDHTELCKYIDDYISCAKSDIPEMQRYVQLQMHKHSKTCRKKGKAICRFGYPMPPMKQTTILSPLISNDDIQKHEKNYNIISETLNEMKDGEDITFTELLLKLSMTEVDYITAIRSSLKQDKIFLKREPSEIRINPYMKNLLGAWKANHDIQFVLDPYACAMYIVSYINKAQKGMSSILEQAAREVKKGNLDLKRQIRHMGNKFLNSVEVSAQEAIYLLLELPLTDSSRKVIFINTSPSNERVSFLKDKEQLEKLPKNSTNIEKSNNIKRYPQRPKQLEECCLAEFLSKWTIIFTDSTKEIDTDIETFAEYEEIENQSKTNLREIHKGKIIFKERQHHAIIRYANYNKNTDPENHFREQLMLFLPWRNEDIDLISTYPTYQQHYFDKLDIIALNSKQYTNKEINLEEAEKQVNKELHQQLYDKLFPNIETTEQQDKDEGSKPSDQFIYYQPDKDNIEFQRSDIGVDLGLGCASSKIAQSDTLLSNDEYYQMVRLLNKKQRQFFTHVLQHLNCQNDTPLHVFLSGGAGVGKSLLIKTLHQALLRELCTKAGEDPSDIRILLCAPTGKAAFNISGQTVHTAFRIQANKYSNYKPLDCDNLNTMRTRYANLSVVIIDEVSMVGNRMFNIINLRLQEIKGNKEDFGNVHMILVGDLFQLKPVKDCWIFKKSGPKKTRHLQNNTFRDLFTFHELTQIMRQKDDKQFAEILNRIRENEHTKLDIDIIKKRHYDQIDCPDTATYLFTSNALVDAFNLNLYNESTSPLKIQIQAYDCINTDLPLYVKELLLEIVKNTKKYKRSDTAGLPYIVNLTTNLQYDITVNINTEDGLTNGTTCIVKYIDFRKQNTTNKRPSIVWVSTNDSNVGKKTRQKYKQLYTNEINPEWIPIFDISRTFPHKSKKNYTPVTRTQLPLVLSAAKTIHKAQGTTLTEVVINMTGYTQKHMHYVALSRATQLSALYITDLNEKKIKIDKFVKAIMKDLRQNHKLQLCYTPVTYLQNDDELSITEIEQIEKNNQTTMKIIYQNIRSLPYHYEDIKADSNYTSSDILVVAETKLISTDQDDMFQLDNYSIIRNDEISTTSQRPHHGLAMYVNNNLKVSNIYRFSEKTLEWILLTATKNDVSIQILGLYKPPKATYQELIDYLQLIPQVVDINQPLIITGDFNIDISDPTIQTPPIISFMENNFNCRQTTPSFTTIRNTTIDLTFTNIINCTTNTIYTPWTDHYLIHTNIPLQ